MPQGKRLKIICICLTGLGSLVSTAQEITVFDTRKALALDSQQKTYRDFYINGGTEVGIKPGLVITVNRRRSLYDAYQNRSPGDLLVPVGQLKIIHAQKGVSVGRLHAIFNRKNLPVVDYDYIMVGDRLDMSTAKMDRSGKKSAAKSSSRRRRGTAAIPVPSTGPMMASGFQPIVPDTLPEKKKRAPKKMSARSAQPQDTPDQPPVDAPSRN